MKIKPSILLLLVSMQLGFSAEFYVSPNGSSSNSGSIDRPLDLATALSSSTPAKAGDTIWLRGGTYPGQLQSYVTGSSSAPVIIRNYNNERAILTGHLLAYGHYVWYWGLEAMDPNKLTQPQLYEFMDCKGAIGNKLINWVIHDHGIGVVASATATDFEAYGCIMYYCGKNSAEHAFYLQNNNVGLKRITDCLIGSVSGYGVHFYANAGQIKGLVLEGNAIWNSGILINEFKSDIIVGGGTAVDNVTITKNYTYTTRGKLGTGLQLGYGDVLNVNAVVMDNYFANFQPMYVCRPFQTLTFTNNTVHAQSFVHKQYYILPGGPYSIDNNRYTTELDIPPFERPEGTRLYMGNWQGITGFDLHSTVAVKARPSDATFVRPNRYEQGRGHVVIYNWTLAPSVNVDVSSIIPVGFVYEVRNAQDYFGPVVFSGVYTGGALSFPMQNLSVATPIGGYVRPPSTAPEFGAFVIISRPASTSNTPPTLSNFSNQTINEDGAAAASFTVGDAETPAASLSVLGSSSNPTLVPNNNIQFSGTGSNRNLTVTPIANQSGNSTISVSVVDGSLVTTKAFTLTVNPVNDGPVISAIPNQTTNKDTATSSISFTVGDLETPVANLSVAGSSSNQSLVPDSNIKFGGSDANRTVTITPAPGQVGTVSISVSVSDGLGQAISTFTLKVNDTGTTISPLAFEAESGVLVSPMVVVSNGQASNGQCISSSTAGQGTATFTVNIPTSGDYYLWCRAYATWDHDSIFVSADGGVEDVYDFPVPFDAWTWGRVKGRTAGNPRKFSFSAGTHRLVVRTRESNTLLDRFVFTSDINFVPSDGGGSTLPLVIEAESAALVSPMTVLSNSLASGGRCVSSSVANQGTVTFALNLPESGTYYVWLRAYASFDHDSVFVSADGGTEDVYDLPKPFDTWYWGRVRGRSTGNPRKFSFSAGSHSLVIRTRESSTLLDRILITNDANYVPTL